MMNLCDSTPQCLAQLRVLIAKSLQHLYVQQYQIEPPRRATRVRDLTFLPHLLELGKPLKSITMQDIANSPTATCPIKPHCSSNRLRSLTNLKGTTNAKHGR